MQKMIIKEFGVEMYMNTYEDLCKYNLAETCVSSMTLSELLDLVGDKEKVVREMLELRLSYGHIRGNPRFKDAIENLYETATKSNIITTHGAIGANHLLFHSLVEKEDEVISIMPSYQQLYSIPESLGAKVKIMPLNAENKFLPCLQLLEKYISERVKLVCINNPHNPSGSVMDVDYMRKIVDVVRPFGAYILCDEVYRGLTHEGNNLTESIYDLYELGISTSSMSKVYSLAGLRLGWIVAPKEVIDKVIRHRDYNTISCGVIDEYLALIALENMDKIFERNLKIAKDNLYILDEWISNEPKASYVKPKGGTTAFVKLDINIPSEDFCIQLLQETGVLVVPGSAFDMEGYIRIGYSYEPTELKAGLELISKQLRAKQS